MARKCRSLLSTALLFLAISASYSSRKGRRCSVPAQWLDQSNQHDSLRRQMHLFNVDGPNVTAPRNLGRGQAFDWPAKVSGPKSIELFSALRNGLPRTLAAGIVHG